MKDNIALRSREYVIQMRGMEIARFELMQGHELAISSGNPDTALAGQTDARSGLRTARLVGPAGPGRPAPAAADTRWWTRSASSERI